MGTSLMRHFKEKVYLRRNYGGELEARVESGILGTEDDVKIMRPEVVAHPAKDEDPEVALQPIPARG